MSRWTWKDTDSESAAIANRQEALLGLLRGVTECVEVGAARGACAVPAAVDLAVL